MAEFNFQPQQPAPQPKATLAGRPGNFLDKPWGLVFGLLFLMAVVALLFAFTRTAQKEEPEPTPTPPRQAQVQASSPAPGVSPPVLPAVGEESKKKVLLEYFSGISPTYFTAKYLERVPDAASDAYQKYSQTEDAEKKLEAAREFYILLNNPAVDRNDAQFVRFIQDVRNDLENTLKSPLF